MESFNYEFQSITDRNAMVLHDMKGETLKGIGVHIAPPEIDIVFLQFEDFIVEVFVAYGFEILSLEITNRLHDMETIELESLEIFKGKVVDQVKILGEAWSGYGFELSFRGLYDKSFIVQSIYAGDKPEGFDDCLRIGIGQYIYGIM